MTQFTKVLVRPRVNQKMAARLLAAGIQQQKRDEASVIMRHQIGAVLAGVDAFRGQRTDAAGNRRPDSGEPVFGWKAEGEQSVSLRQVRDDLNALGLALVNANLMQKPNDQMAFLYLTFAPAGPETILSEEADRLISQILDRTHEHLHVFVNPDGSATINPAHPLDRVSPSEIRDLRINEDGKFTLVQRTPPRLGAHARHNQQPSSRTPRKRAGSFLKRSFLFAAFFS